MTCQVYTWKATNPILSLTMGIMLRVLVRQRLVYQHHKGDKKKSKRDYPVCIFTQEGLRNLLVVNHCGCVRSLAQLRNIHSPQNDNVMSVEQ